MTKASNFLAFDLGAESGRAMVGGFAGKRLSLEEMHRFPNGSTRIHDHLHWSTLNLFTEMKQGLAKTVSRHRVDFSAIGWQRGNLGYWGIVRMQPKTRTAILLINRKKFNIITGVLY